MKVLLINGSPKGKRSHTYQLSTSFIDGMNQVQKDLMLDEIWVNGLNLSPCLGCFSCWKKTPGKCIIKDDMENVIEKLLWADVVVWSFPLYYFSIPSQLKTLIDRQLPMVLPFMEKDSESGGHPLRYDMSHKKHVVISTCGFYTTEGNYDAVISMFNHFLGKENYETIFCSQGELFGVPELSNRTDEYLQVVKKAGQEYINDKIQETTKRQLKALLFPKETFEAMADASWGIEKETGEKVDESLVFTKQMASLYNKQSYQGKDIVLEMNYTDINKTYQIVLKKESYEVLTHHFLPYTTRIETSFVLWGDIASGKISGSKALMKQMYKVQGDFDLMVHWGRYFLGTNNQNEKEDDMQSLTKTNMMILLLPWILFWIFISIPSSLGGYICIISCTFIPLLFYKNKKTIYDLLSMSFITILSVLSLWHIDKNILLSMSYLVFGMMWIISCLNKIPLTAYYSVNDYDGEKMLYNSLFLKTNRILTFMWGFLYILISVVSYYVMKTSYSSYLGIIKNVLPILMGAFTVWFQKWYPAKVARGK